MKQMMVATRDMRYGTRRLKAGEEFEARGQHARLLAKLGRATYPKKADPKPTRKPDPFDHNGDGKPGGSTRLEPSDELKAARDDYFAALGKRPWHGWEADTIRAKMAEAESADD